MDPQHCLFPRCCSYEQNLGDVIVFGGKCHSLLDTRKKLFEKNALLSSVHTRIMFGNSNSSKKKKTDNVEYLNVLVKLC